MRVLVIEGDNEIGQMPMDEVAADGAKTIYGAGNLTDALAIMRREN